MKNRKGFGKININGKKFQFNWADNPGGAVLFMYDGNDKKIEIPYHIWELVPTSEEFLKKSPTWHGKHKRGPEWGCYGKRMVREMYLKYLRFTSEKSYWKEK